VPRLQQTSQYVPSSHAHGWSVSVSAALSIRNVISERMRTSLYQATFARLECESICSRRVGQPATVWHRHRSHATELGLLKGAMLAQRRRAQTHPLTSTPRGMSGVRVRVTKRRGLIVELRIGGAFAALRRRSTSTWACCRRESYAPTQVRTAYLSLHNTP
jgi:hypothetical protein